MSLYHELTSLPRVQKLTDKRKKTLRVRWKQYPDIEKFRELFTKAGKSEFLSGRNGKWTGCNFDWLINEANMVKVLEGNYDEKRPDKPPPEQTEWIQTTLPDGTQVMKPVTRRGDP